MDRNSVLRKGYLEKLSEFRDDTGLTKVIAGMRRCGKSTHSVAKNLSIDNETADSYLSSVSELLMFYRVKRYDLRGKMILRTLWTVAGTVNISRLRRP
jgi:predicted AAA+ superfamily ATPase